MTTEIDLGNGRRIQPIVECPHDPRCRRRPECIEPALAGWVFIHPKPGEVDIGFGPDMCSGMVYARAERVGERPRKVWQIDQHDPLTLSPSIRCTAEGCTEHGWIRDGKWVPA